MLKSGQGMGSTSDAPVPVHGGGYRHGRDQVYQRGAAVGRTGRRRCAGVRQHQRAGVGFYPYFLAGLMLLCLQISCGFAVMRGRNWGRWGYVVCQCIVVLTCCWPPSAAFSPGVYRGRETSGQILHVLIPQDPRRGDPGVAVRPYRQPPLLRRAQVRFRRAGGKLCALNSSS